MKITYQSKNHIKITSQVDGGKDLEIEKLQGGNYTSNTFIVSMAKKHDKVIDMYLTIQELLELREWITQRLADS